MNLINVYSQETLARRFSFNRFCV